MHATRETDTWHNASSAYLCPMPGTQYDMLAMAWTFARSHSLADTARFVIGPLSLVWMVISDVGTLDHYCVISTS